MLPLLILTIPSLTHGLDVRHFAEHVVGTNRSRAQCDEDCFDLALSVDSHVTIADSLFEMVFPNVGHGYNMVLKSYNYEAVDPSKTGVETGGLAKINMAPDTTTYYSVSFEMDGERAFPPCFSLTVLDIDCNKMGCQSLSVDLNDIPNEYFIGDSISATQDSWTGVWTFTSTAGGKSPNPTGLPLSAKEAKSAVEFKVTLGSFAFSYTTAPSSNGRGGSFMFAGHGGVGAAPTPCPETTTTTTTTKGMCDFEHGDQLYLGVLNYHAWHRWLGICGSSPTSCGSGAFAMSSKSTKWTVEIEGQYTYFRAGGTYLGMCGQPPSAADSCSHSAGSLVAGISKGPDAQFYVEADIFGEGCYLKNPHYPNSGYVTSVCGRWAGSPGGCNDAEVDLYGYQGRSRGALWEPFYS